MPTARELLEQADALMKRNRQETTRSPSMPPVPPAVEQGVPPERVRVEPRIVEEVAKAVPAAPPAAAVAPAEADVPVLEDAVADFGDDDVPLLTDAVDEIEVAAPGVDEGEPSDWLEEPRGDDESVLGPSPPSVVLVPPATLAPHAAVRLADRVSDGQGRVEPTLDLEDLPSEPLDADVTIRRAVPDLGAPPPPPRPVPPEIEDLAGSAPAELDADVTWTRPLQAGPAVGRAMPSGEPGPAEPVPSPAAILQDARPEAAHGRDLPQGAEREALAEEIRMQVLQRIDMFTDAGLRERLGERLKPIVDRASADLVDAINQHVGEILRAYVAEAIEREIDRWRSGR